MAGPSLDGLINADMLVWAREQSRMDVATAAKKINQSAERLAEWENDSRVPTLNQLRELANVYKRSVGIFFLVKRPNVQQRPIDYRQLEVSSRNSMSSTLANGIREAASKREAALDIFTQLEQKPPAWNLTIDSNTPPLEAATTILERLGVTMQTRGSWTSQYEAFSGWRTAVESLGVIVVQLSRVPMEEMRGCSLAMFPLPVIALNSADSPLGRVFTLLHELTHLARAESALCDLAENVPRSRANDAVEAYCNGVAGAILVPPSELMKHPEVLRARKETEWSLDELRGMSRVYWASRETILRRLLDSGKTSQEFYKTMHEQFKKEYATNRKQPGGPIPYYRRVLLSNGRLLSRLAVDAYGSRTITGTELSRILNAKLDHLPRIREALANEVVA